MALIKCPECQQPISSTVKSCPHCGYVLSDEEKIKALEEALDNPVSFPKTVSQPFFNTFQSEAIFQINGKRARVGQCKIQDGAFYYKNTGFNWPVFWLVFLFLTVIGSFIRGAVVPHSWEKLFNQSDFTKIAKKRHDFGHGEKKAFVIATNDGKKFIFAPELYEQWEAYFDSLSLDELVEEDSAHITSQTESPNELIEEKTPDIISQDDEKQKFSEREIAAIAVIATLAIITIIVVIVLAVVLKW